MQYSPFKTAADFAEAAPPPEGFYLRWIDPSGKEYLKDHTGTVKQLNGGGSGGASGIPAEAIAAPDTAAGTVQVRPVAVNPDGSTSWAGEAITARYMFPRVGENTAKAVTIPAVGDTGILLGDIFMVLAHAAAPGDFFPYLLSGTAAGAIAAPEPVFSFADPAKAEQGGILGKYAILNGKLYRITANTLIQHSSRENWEAVLSTGSDPANFSTWGLAGGSVYYITGVADSETAVASGNIVKIAGAGNYTRIGALTADGQLLVVDSSGASRYGSAAYSDISAASDQQPLGYFYAIMAVGRLQYITGYGNSWDAVVGEDNRWTAISGASYEDSNSEYGYGICNGALYALQQQNATLIDDSKTWSKVYGFSYGSYFGFAIDADGRLHTLYGTSAAQIGDLTGWTQISGVGNNQNGYYAYGLCNGKLYALTYNTVTAVDPGRDYAAVQYGSNPAAPAFALAEGE